MAKKVGNLSDKIVPVLLVLSIGLAFGVGVLWQKVENLESGKVAAVETTADQGSNQPQQPQGPSQGKLSPDQAAGIPKVSSSDRIRGNRNAKVFLIEYSDFECPYCAKFHPTAAQAMEEYGDDLAWVYRHFPLDQLHPKARPAAEASECVKDLGGNESFWKFADYIFEDPTLLEDLATAAEEAGVDKDAFQSCVDGGKFAQIVDDHYQGGIGAGVTGTPGNFIVNQKGEAWLIPGAVPFESLKATIDEALNS